MLYPRRPGSSFRRLPLLAFAVVLVVLVAPAVAAAHPSTPVIAVDYEAKLDRSDVAAGVAARVLDGNRKLELTVRKPHTVVVEGYGDEQFLRFDAAGVEVNERSLTAVTNKLTRSGATPALGSTATPRWRSISRSHRYAWHDHRLALVPGSMARTGRVGTWSIPLRIDGTQARVQGGLWHDSGGHVWPWLLLLAAAASLAVVVALRGSERLRRTCVYVCVAVAGASFLVASSGFSLAHSTPGAWLSISLPFVIGAIAAAVFILRPELRYGIAACAGMLILAEGLSQLSVFLHGYVISTLGTPVARGAVAVAVLGGLVASVIALVSLFSNRTWRPAPVHVKTTPKLAIPRGRRR